MAIWEHPHPTQRTPLSAKGGGHTTGTMWEQYARMRDALNATGRPIYFSITQAEDWADGHPRMHCYGDGAFSTLFWTRANPPLDPRELANSYLVEYCNGMDFFGYTDGVPKPGGFLSNLDSQQLLTTDNMSSPGAWADGDMLEVCNGGQTDVEYTAQFSLWAALASPLILGNDVRTLTPACASIILNQEVIGINQDALGVRGALVLQWPEAVWPPVDPPLAARAPGSSAAPPSLGTLRMAPCNASDPAQLFTFDPATRYILTSARDCLTYGGYKESNFAPAACAHWSVPGVGSQLWQPDAQPDGTLLLRVVDNTEKVADVLDCNIGAPGTVQVCTVNGTDCFSSPPGPPGCGTHGQFFRANWAGGAPSTIASPLAGGTHCVAAGPLPQSPIDIRLQVWAKPLANGDVAFVAFNRSPGPLVANVTWEMLGKEAGVALRLRDVWAHEDLGTFVGAFSGEVESHGVIMVRASAA